MSVILSLRDRKLLNRLQERFPVAANPYAIIGAELNMEEQEVINRVAELKQGGYIRRIGPSFDSAKLGYISTLIAMAVPEEKIEATAAVINRYPGVTHNYVRAGKYNVWFTFIASSEDYLKKALGNIQKISGVHDILILPATRLFKVNVNLQIPEDQV